MNNSRSKFIHTRKLLLFLICYNISSNIKCADELGQLLQNFDASKLPQNCLGNFYDHINASTKLQNTLQIFSKHNFKDVKNSTNEQIEATEKNPKHQEQHKPQQTSTQNDTDTNKDQTINNTIPTPTVNNSSHTPTVNNSISTSQNISTEEKVTQKEAGKQEETNKEQNKEQNTQHSNPSAASQTHDMQTEDETDSTQEKHNGTTAEQQKNQNEQVSNQDNSNTQDNSLKDCPQDQEQTIQVNDTVDQNCKNHNSKNKKKHKEHNIQSENYTIAKSSDSEVCKTNDSNNIEYEIYNSQQVNEQNIDDINNQDINNSKENENRQNDQLNRSVTESQDSESGASKLSMEFKQDEGESVVIINQDDTAEITKQVQYQENTTQIDNQSTDHIPSITPRCENSGQIPNTKKQNNSIPNKQRSKRTRKNSGTGEQSNSNSASINYKKSKQRKGNTQNSNVTIIRNDNKQNPSPTPQTTPRQINTQDIKNFDTLILTLEGKNGAISIKNNKDKYKCVKGIIQDVIDTRKKQIESRAQTKNTSETNKEGKKSTKDKQEGQVNKKDLVSINENPESNREILTEVSKVLDAFTSNWYRMKTIKESLSVILSDYNKMVNTEVNKKKGDYTAKENYFDIVSSILKTFDKGWFSGFFRSRAMKKYFKDYKELLLQLQDSKVSPELLKRLLQSSEKIKYQLSMLNLVCRDFIRMAKEENRVYKIEVDPILKLLDDMFDVSKMTNGKQHEKRKKGDNNKEQQQQDNTIRPAAKTQDDNDNNNKQNQGLNEKNKKILQRAKNKAEKILERYDRRVKKK